MLLTAIGLVVFVAAGLTGVSAQQAPAPGAPAAGGARTGGPQIVWSPKVTKPGDWTPPHKPHTTLVDLLARHKGKTDWVETIVDGDTLHADYISSAPGAKTPRRMNADTREWWVVQDGQIRFTIDGILGCGIPPPPATDKGHFHTESSEFWFILLGQIRYNIEGLPVFVADQGDIVYVPNQRWHLASFAGDGPSARLAMNGYPDLAHSFEANEGR
jgi:mannose-6-phosphate isomerase-like protein (cupin superfamily)